MYQLCKTVESVLNLSAVNLTLPVHFRESVLLYTLTGSKLALRILGSGGAHASYNSVKSWLTNLGTVESEEDDGDIIVGFDNNQVLQRRWKVKLRNEVKCNIVTVVVYFVVRKHGRLQHNIEGQPSKWSRKELTEGEIQKIKFIDQSEKIRDTHYTFLYRFIEQEIRYIAAQQCTSSGVFTDNIDLEVEKLKHQALYKSCYNCKFDQIPKSKHLCPMCKVNVTKSKMRAMGIEEDGSVVKKGATVKKAKEYRVSVEGESSTERYSHKLHYEKQTSETSEYDMFKDEIPENYELPTVHVQQPVNVNPCSYQAVATVLRNIGHRSGRIKKYEGIREWVTVVCDGIPYNLCNRIIQSMHVCNKCDISLNGMKECQQHQVEVHPDEAVTFQKEFDWVLLQPGMGHIEMNMVKGLVELAWEVFWKNMVMCFNFRSETALKYAKKVNDHHKGWTLCRIARKAITQELILPFVRHQMAQQEPHLSPEDFFKYVMNARDPNYVFMCDFTFEILDSVFLYRAGVRCGISKFISAGRAKFAKLWCGRNHPLYRELEVADTVQLIRMPMDVRQFVEDTASLNLSGKLYTGEGADFRLEEVNRQVQQWLPNIPSTEDWKIACSNFDKLSELRKRIFEQMDIADPKLSASSHIQNIDDEIVAFRTKLREQKYLSSPLAERAHVSLDGEPLDPNLRYFCKLARENRARYVDCYLSHDRTADQTKAGPPSFDFTPVFVNKAEREKYLSVENLSVPQIKVQNSGIYQYDNGR